MDCRTDISCLCVCVRCSVSAQSYTPVTMALVFCLEGERAVQGYIFDCCSFFTYIIMLSFLYSDCMPP